MDVQLNSMPTPVPVKADPQQAAKTFGVLLRQTPEYENFLNALNEVNNHPNVLKISTLIRDHRNALRWFQGDSSEHEAALTMLETELEALPVVQKYRQAEGEVKAFFRAVDEIISQEAGVAFAVNAKRTGCCG